MNILAQLGVIHSRAIPKPTKAPRAPRTSLNLSPEAVLARTEYQAKIIAALDLRGAMSSSAVGKSVGVDRLTSYQRLLVLEKAGLVKRTGSGPKTLWELPEVIKDER